MRNKSVTNAFGSRRAKLFMIMGDRCTWMVCLFVNFVNSGCSRLYGYAGANLNAQIGLTNPATCGGDVCHLNLHKTSAM